MKSSGSIGMRHMRHTNLIKCIFAEKYRFSKERYGAFLETCVHSFSVHTYGL